MIKKILGIINKILGWILDFIIGRIKQPVINTKPVVVETWCQSIGTSIYLFTKYSDGSVTKEKWDEEDPTGVSDFINDINK
jgi:hypothetical protein